MTQIVIDTGAVPNDGTGAPLRTAFTEVNQNFTQLFAAGPVDSNIQITGNQIRSTNTNGNINLVPNGIGTVVVNSSIIPDIASIRNLGSVNKPFNEIFVNYAEIANLVVNNFVVHGNLQVDRNASIGGNLAVGGDITGNSFTGTTVGTHNGLVYDIDIRWMVWDFAFIQPNTYTNPIQYLLDNAPPVDMGTILDPTDLNINTGFF
jgi:hypothetical protein